MSHASRQARMGDVLGEEGLDALIVTDLVNVRYLCGFIGSNGVLVVTPSSRVLLTDSRYTAAARTQVHDTEVVIAGRDLMDRLAEVVPGGRVGIEAEHMTVARRDRMAARLSGVELVATAGLVEGLRVVKEPGELDLIRDATRIADSALSRLIDEGFRGRTEAEVAWDLEGWMRANGAEGASFDIIVAGGAHGARPHAVPLMRASRRTPSWWSTWVRGTRAMHRTARAPSPRVRSRPRSRRPIRYASRPSVRPSPPAGRVSTPRTSTRWRAGSSPTRVSGSTSATASGMAWGSTSMSARGCVRRAGRYCKPAWL